jgi:hypothetical protein
VILILNQKNCNLLHYHWKENYWLILNRIAFVEIIGLQDIFHVHFPSQYCMEYNLTPITSYSWPSECRTVLLYKRNGPRTGNYRYIRKNLVKRTTQILIFSLSIQPQITENISR